MFERWHRRLWGTTQVRKSPSVDEVVGDDIILNDRGSTGVGRKKAWRVGAETLVKYVNTTAKAVVKLTEVVPAQQTQEDLLELGEALNPGSEAEVFSNAKGKEIDMSLETFEANALEVSTLMKTVPDDFDEPGPSGYHDMSYTWEEIEEQYDRKQISHGEMTIIRDGRRVVYYNYKELKKEIRNRKLRRMGRRLAFSLQYYTGAAREFVQEVYVTYKPRPHDVLGGLADNPLPPPVAHPVVRTVTRVLGTRQSNRSSQTVVVKDKTEPEVEGKPKKAKQRRGHRPDELEYDVNSIPYVSGGPVRAGPSSYNFSVVDETKITEEVEEIEVLLHKPNGLYYNEKAEKYLGSFHLDKAQYYNDLSCIRHRLVLEGRADNFNVVDPKLLPGYTGDLGGGHICPCKGWPWDPKTFARKSEVCIFFAMAVKYYHTNVVDRKFGRMWVEGHLPGPAEKQAWQSAVAEEMRRDGASPDCCFYVSHAVLEYHLAVTSKDVAIFSGLSTSPPARLLGLGIRSYYKWSMSKV